jgi:uncharacterized glyoxalase superfamily protein PhnB
MNLIPVLRYKDCPAAIEWLVNAFGFERKSVHEGEGGTIDHAELAHGDGIVMLGSDRGSDDRFATGPSLIYAVVEDPDAHHDRAKAAGAEIWMELTDQDYGSREYAAKDPEGNVWSFGTYRPGAA